jgi:hypothetical protein
MTNGEIYSKMKSRQHRLHEMLYQHGIRPLGRDHVEQADGRAVRLPCVLAQRRLDYMIARRGRCDRLVADILRHIHGDRADAPWDVLDCGTDLSPEAVVRVESLSAAMCSAGLALSPLDEHNWYVTRQRADGFTCTAAGDDQRLIPAYIEWGDGCVDQIVGHFRERLSDREGHARLDWAGDD